MSEVFTVSEKLVRERDGKNYSLDKYTEGVDYVKRRVRYGFRVVFRKGFLGPVVDTVDPSLVEHKQKDEPSVSDVIVELAKMEMQEADAPVVAKIIKTYPNPRFVDTDACGRVFCGEKGRNLRQGQMILVSNGRIVIGKAGKPSVVKG